MGELEGTATKMLKVMNIHGLKRDGSSDFRLPTSDSPSLPSPVTHLVELFGVPRVLLRERVVEAAGATLGAVAADLGRRYPVLCGRVLDAESDWLLPGYSFVVADRFSRDPALVLPEGATILLVASAAGG